MTDSNFQRLAPNIASGLERASHAFAHAMKKKWTWCAWCWVAYSIPAALLLLWHLSLDRPGDGIGILLYLYGSPAIPLLLSIASLFWTHGGTEQMIVMAVIAAGANGALLFGFLHLIRSAASKKKKPNQPLEPTR